MTQRAPSPIRLAPTYAIHRKKVAVADSTFTDRALGVNGADHDTAHVQVIPNGSTVNVEVLFWSDAAEKFISEVTPITHNAIATPREFSFDVKGRIFLVAVKVIDTGDVQILTSGYSRFPR